MNEDERIYSEIGTKCCIDCQFYCAPSIYGYHLVPARCLHISAAKEHMVFGDREYSSCEFERTQGSCGREAKNFTPWGARRTEPCQHS